MTRARSPSAIRVARAWASRCRNAVRPLEIGKGRIVREGSGVAILSFGAHLANASARLKSSRRWVFRPRLPMRALPSRWMPQLIGQLARHHKALITVEQGATGGFGALVLHHLADHGALDRGLRIRTMTLPDSFIDHASPAEMYAAAGLTARHIAMKATEALGVVSLPVGQARA